MLEKLWGHRNKDVPRSSFRFRPKIPFFVIYKKNFDSRNLGEPENQVSNILTQNV